MSTACCYGIKKIIPAVKMTDIEMAEKEIEDFLSLEKRFEKLEINEIVKDILSIDVG